jgi:hypothetical protein
LTVEEALNHKWFKRFGVSAESNSNLASESSLTSNLTNEKHPEPAKKENSEKANTPVAVELDRPVQVVTLDDKLNNQANEIVTSVEANMVVIDVSETKASTSGSSNNIVVIHQQHQEIKDDKNNNSLASLTEADIKSSSLSSISSTCSLENGKLIGAEDALNERDAIANLTSNFSEICVETSAMINTNSTTGNNSQMKSVSINVSDYKTSLSHHSHFSSHFTDQFSQLNGNMEQHRTASSLASNGSVMVTASNQLATN